MVDWLASFFVISNKFGWHIASRCRFLGSRRQSFWTSSMRNHLQQIEQRIFVVRNQQVIMDRDLAALYEVETSQLNRQVKRNIQRFPEDFMFQLTKEEVESLKCQNGISKSRGGDRYLPYVFTEQGVSMLSGLLRSETAMQVNILIMRAFVAMRRFLVANAQIFQRLDRLNRKQLKAHSPRSNPGAFDTVFLSHV